ncbi:hypothetical protein BY996DRAFT_6544627 [Phakopsora pachyrhizi]|nr:hypothetical protein BY996DRAFT_6544627 [Phakopsora pachyrhizi]
MRERLKKKGREGKVEAFVKGLNSGSLDVVNYDYLTVSHKFTGGKLQDKVENITINGGKMDGLLDAALNGKGKGYKFGAGGDDDDDDDDDYDDDDDDYDYDDDVDQ